MGGVFHPFIISVAQLCQYSQPVKHVIVEVHREVKGGECSVHGHPFMMVSLVQPMHEQEFGTSLHRPLHPSCPCLSGDLRVGPERLYCRHEGTVSHLDILELRIITVPTTVLELSLRHPVNGSSDPGVLAVP